MTMTFSVNASFDSDESFYPWDGGGNTSNSAVDSASEEFHFLTEKMSIPTFEDILHRPRLGEMMEKSLSQFGATLISGRSGTGKTALAAGFANNRRKVAWYSVESADVDWRVFSRYFSTSLSRTLADSNLVSETPQKNSDVSRVTIEQFLAEIFARIDAEPHREPRLIVLDDLHHVFDAPWFGEFFTSLLYSLDGKAQLLLLCRSRPPSPLWRLRSKQMLNVIDEKILAFNMDETKDLFRRMGVSAKIARKAHADSFGRIAKVKQIANRILASDRKS